jgi:hypothetical protein
MTLENRLREALRPVDPGAGFADAVLARAQQPQQMQELQRPARRWQIPVALAASLLVAITGLQLLQQQRERARALEAQQQLQIALAITSAQLTRIQQRLSARDNEENGT